MMIGRRPTTFGEEGQSQDIDKLQIARRPCCGCRRSPAHHPELNGVVTRVSPDVTTQRTGQSYYTSASGCRAKKSRASREQADPDAVEASCNRRPHHAVVLIKPLSDQLMRSFREK